MGREGEKTGGAHPGVTMLKQRVLGSASSKDSAENELSTTRAGRGERFKPSEFINHNYTYIEKGELYQAVWHYKGYLIAVCQYAVISEKKHDIT